MLWSVPAAKEVDGASIPQTFWSFIGGPFEGAYIRASVIHDYYCDVKVRTEHDTHRNFYYGMRAAGVEEWKAKFMYWAVATFGPKWTLAKRIVQKLKCSAAPSGQLTCDQVPETTIEMVSAVAVDLSDPDTLAAAISRASTVARSLKTTDGKVLDVSAVGEVPATLNNIATNSAQYRQIFTNRTFIQAPSQLGVLSQWKSGGLEQVKPWEKGKLPRIADALILQPSAIEMIESGKSFKLTPSGTDLMRERIDFKALEYRAIQGNKLVPPR